MSADRIGCYVLPGGVSDSRPALSQAKKAEELGLGAVWIGERFDTKDLPSIAGAISAITTDIRIGAAITPIGLRHPMVLASMGQTLQSLSNSRFLLGFGRSAAWRFNAYGLPHPTLESIGDTAIIVRKLWAGETVTYSGPAGNFPNLRLPQRPDNPPPPVLLAAVGPKTLELAGRAFDGVILHPFVTPEAVERSMKIVRDAAERAGRDPSKLRCCATVVTAPDMDQRDTGLAIGSRAAGYFHVAGLGDALVRINGWSEDDLAKYRSHPTFSGLGDKQADKALSRDVLVELSETMPSHWIPSSSAFGTSAQCSAILQKYLDAGADEIVMHGGTAPSFGGIAKAFG